MAGSGLAALNRLRVKSGRSLPEIRRQLPTALQPLETH